MAFIIVEENPYSVQLVDSSLLTEKTFNPRDYIDFSNEIQVDHKSLSSLAEIGGNSIKCEAGNRVKASQIDRATGEIDKPTEELKDVTCLRFDVGDILFHKYAGRIGRVGLANFEGIADSHFMRIRPSTVNGYYLLWALRSRPVLLQLPYREVARPGIWNSDLEKLQIPRLGVLEEDLGIFVKEIFDLRKRAKNVMKDLLDSFNTVISSKMPTDYYFFMGVQTLSDETLDPGYYFMKAIEMMFPEHMILGNEVDMNQAPYLKAGDEYTSLTLSDFRFEGIVPQKLKGVQNLWKKNYVKSGELILNRLHSNEDKIVKATVVIPNLGYLKETGLSLNSEGQVPIYEQLFRLRMKPSSNVSPYYLSVVLNSELFQRMFRFMMAGSTGRQRIRKAKLEQVRLPILPDAFSNAFSEATKISMEILSETLRILIQLNRVYEKIVYGKEKPEIIQTIIQKEKELINDLSGNSIKTAEAHFAILSEFRYEMSQSSLN